MSCPKDKDFTAVDNCPQDETFSPAPAPVASAFVAPTPGAVDPAASFPSPWGDYQIQPDQAAALGLEVDQFLNRQALVLKAVGEEALIYRQKRHGQVCACVDPSTNQAQDGCFICFGARFVGGYDLIGKTAAYIGPSPLVRKLTEIGLSVSQKPVLYILPDVPVKDRDFVVAKMRTPMTEVLREFQESVVRGAVDPDIDVLKKLNIRKIVKISLGKNGGEDFTEGRDFILTGGELVVEDAQTPSPNDDTRILRVLGKRAPLFPPDSETPTGETDPVRTLFENAGLNAGLGARVFNRAAKPQSFSVDIENGTGMDAGFLIVTLVGDPGSKIADSAKFPASSFVVTVDGDAILWLADGQRPPLSAVYFVTYEFALNVTRRYQVISPTETYYQGVVIGQQAEIELMEPTHPIYNVASIFDNGTPLDRQVANLDSLRKTLAAESGLVTEAPNLADPRFVNPGDFF